MTFFATHPRHRSVRRCRLETLQPRHLMAYAAFDLQLRSDLDGAPGEIIPQFDGEVSVQQGESYYLDVRLAEYHPARHGMAAVGVNVQWDEGLLEVIEDDFVLDEVLTDQLPSGRGGQLFNDNGEIVGLRADNALLINGGTTLGDNELETFAMIRIEAEQSGTARVELDESVFPNVAMPLATFTGHRIRMDQLTIQIEATPNTSAQQTPVEIETPTLTAPIVPASDPVSLANNIVEAESEPVDTVADPPTNPEPVLAAAEGVATVEKTVAVEVPESLAIQSQIVTPIPATVAQPLPSPIPAHSNPVQRNQADSDRSEIEPTASANLVHSDDETCEAVFAEPSRDVQAEPTTSHLDTEALFYGPVMPVWFAAAVEDDERERYQAAVDELFTAAIAIFDEDQE